MHKHKKKHIPLLSSIEDPPTCETLEILSTMPNGGLPLLDSITIPFFFSYTGPPHTVYCRLKRRQQSIASDTSAHPLA